MTLFRAAGLYYRAETRYGVRTAKLEAMADEEYSPEFVRGLEWMWGEGFLSPGGAAEVRELLAATNLAGRSVLDIGCGIGGVDILLVQEHGASSVVGIDVAETLLKAAQQNVTDAGLSELISFKHVAGQSLPFTDQTFDVVFSKDAIIQIPDKVNCYAEIRRVLKPGGAIAISDWFGSSLTQSDEMKRWLQVVGLKFDLATLGETLDIVSRCGFDDVIARDRNAWYRQYMTEELAALQGEAFDGLVERVGQDVARHRLESSTLKQQVVDQGQLRPGHITARLPQPEPDR